MALDQARVSGPWFDPSGAFRIDIAGPSRLLTVAFVGLWCLGWFLGIASSLSESLRLGRIDLPDAAVLLVWVVAGAPMLAALLWTARGRRETFLIRGESFAIVRAVGPFRRVTALETLAIRRLGAVPARAPLVTDLDAVRRFWVRGSGPVVFQHGRHTYACGSALDTAGAAKLAADLAALVPSATATEDSAVPAPSSTIAPWGVAYLAMTMLFPAARLPFDLAITDRAICFGYSAPPPANPISVTNLPAAGRVYLVPVDGYSSERAREIAAHFRQHFGVRIGVEPALLTPAEAYDVSREQMNAGGILDALEARYPEGSPRTVVIGLTSADMFIPGWNWRYAFSYREGGRIGIVSSARMDRGCLGLLPVGGARQLARMRKMVGKNIGVMYYGLPLSRDSRSMLYGYVRGPQELDTMSEMF